MMRRTLLLLLPLFTGCALLTTEEERIWNSGKELQAQGRHEEAVQKFASVLNRHREAQDAEELLCLRLDLAESYFALERYAEAENILKALEADPRLEQEKKERTYELLGWIALEKVRRGGGSPARRRELLFEARRNFRRFLSLHPDAYKALLGEGLALYETSKLYGTKTHLAHAYEIFKRCARRNENDPTLLFARSRAMQGLMGPGTKEALSLLRQAFARDRKLKEQVIYRELFEEILPYPNPILFKREVTDPERRACLETYRTILAEAVRRPSARGPFWERVRKYLETFEREKEREKRFREGIAHCRKILLKADLSPLGAAQEALRVLEETEKTAGKQLSLLTDKEYESIRKEIFQSLLNALERKISTYIEIENITVAEELLSSAFKVVARKDTPEALRWARKFQELKEKVFCRRRFVKARGKIRRELLEKGAEEIRSELAALREKFRLCAEERDFAELREELFASQSVAFQRAVEEAEAAGRRKDFKQERKLLSKALALTRSKEFSHRRAEILLKLARSYIQTDLWEQARLYLEEIREEDRTPEAFLVLGTALARGESYKEAYRIFSRRELADELKIDPRWAAAAGLTFAKQGQDKKAVPLLAAATNAANVKLPFDRERLVEALTSSLTRLLSGTASMEETTEEWVGENAEALFRKGKGDRKLAAALGGWFFRRRKWDKAVRYLVKAKEWGERVSEEILSRLRAHIEDYSPLRPGLSWKYRQEDGQQLTVTVLKSLGANRFSVELRTAGASESLVWEKRSGGRVLCRYFGGGLRHCHYFPVGLPDPSENAPLPVEEYEVNGRTWKARLAALDETVSTECGTFTHCLLVEVTPPGSAVSVRHYFAPGVGEVAVEYPADQRSMSRSLVSFTRPKDPQAAARDLGSPSERP